MLTVLLCLALAVQTLALAWVILCLYALRERFHRLDYLLTVALLSLYEAGLLQQVNAEEATYGE